MSPRRYSMERRAALQADTRRRIVDAAVALHAKRGILATKPVDIAARADVTLTTYYKHFASRGDLVTACTTRGRELIPPPAPGPLAHEPDADARIRLAVRTLFEYYARREPWLYAGRTEERFVPELQPVMARLRDLRNAFVETVISSPRAAPSQKAVARALLDFWSWWMLRHDGRLSQSDTCACVAQALQTILNTPRRSRAARRAVGSQR